MTDKSKNNFAEFKARLARLSDEDAIALLNENIRDNTFPENVSYLLFQKAVVLKFVDINECIHTYQECIEKYPQEIGAFYFLAEIYAENGKFKEAIGIIGKSLLQEKSQAYLYYEKSLIALRCYCYARLGNTKLAIADFETVPEDSFDHGWIELDPPLTKASVMNMIKNIR